MDKIIKAMQAAHAVKRDDDVVDRISHRYTVLLLIVFTIVISSQLYIGKPITCWCDKHFTGNHIKYTNAYCWVRNTYVLPLSEEIPKKEDPDRDYILYYQWLPFILLGQALFFYLPSAVWHGLNQKAGVDCDTILATADRLQNEHKPEKRTQYQNMIAAQMERFLSSRATDDNSNLCSLNCVRRFLCCSSRGGFYLVVLYMFSKVLYIFNVIMQLYVLNFILKTSYSIYGWEFITNVLADDHWVNSPAFPRITMCDLSVRRLGNVHDYTVQCVLPINMFTEKIYAFLWFWMVFVACLTVLNTIMWLGRVFAMSDRVQYVSHNITHETTADKSDKREITTDFINSYLGQDGVFILRLIGHNCNKMIVAEVTDTLFQQWTAKKKNRALMGDDQDNNTDSEDSLPRKPRAPGIDQPDGVYPNLGASL